MRKIWVGTLSLVLVSLCGCKRHDVVAEVTAVEQQIAPDYASGNVAGERDRLADDFVGIDQDGLRYNKEKAIAEVSEFKRSGITFTSDGITVQPLGDNVAIARGFDHYRKADGTPYKNATWTDVWILRDGAWRMAASHDAWLPR